MKKVAIFLSLILFSFLSYGQTLMYCDDYIITPKSVISDCSKHQIVVGFSKDSTLLSYSNAYAFDSLVSGKPCHYSVPKKEVWIPVFTPIYTTVNICKNAIQGTKIETVKVICK